jgi:hypothetical protein
VPDSFASSSLNPVGVGKVRATISQGSSFLATLGFEPKSLWDFPALSSPSELRSRKLSPLNLEGIARSAPIREIRG